MHITGLDGEIFLSGIMGESIILKTYSSLVSIRVSVSICF